MCTHEAKKSVMVVHSNYSIVKCTPVGVINIHYEIFLFSDIVIDSRGKVDEVN